MYEPYSRQSLPDKEYRTLLGSALCVFSSNNAFIIENILRIDNTKYDWYALMDRTSGGLEPIIRETICKVAGDCEIADVFKDIIRMRDRIVHSFQITDKDGEQRLATKEKQKNGNKQFVITKELLLEFIAKNGELSSKLHSFRRKITGNSLDRRVEI